MSRSRLKILTVVGARPQFVKAAMISRAIVFHNKQETHTEIVEEIIHTGQHYDHAMSQVFFDEMGISQPVVNLAVGSASRSRGETTARMLEGIEREILVRRPDWVLVYGDTNSTLAGALAAAQLHVPVAHVEAGLRSFNRRMPEETNRVLTDHVSDLLFCPTKAAVENLGREGITRGVHHVGDVMYDAAVAFGEIAREKSPILDELGLKPKQYYLATVHRAENTDDRGRLAGILQGLSEAACHLPVIFPVHPRTRKCIHSHSLQSCCDGIQMVEPLPFLDMVRLEQEARMILTDSGGVQKEAYFHGVPCVTLRDETEWVETVEAGWNRVVGAAARAIALAVRFSGKGRPIDQYGQGNASGAVLAGILSAVERSCGD